MQPHPKNMTKIHRAKGFDINISDDEIARVLGYGQNQIPERVRAVIAEIERNEQELISTACAYRYLTNDEFSHSEYLHCVEQVVMCLVTIGGGLEARVEQYKQAGDLSQALILDTYGSAAAEAAADVAEELIRKELDAKGLKYSKRFSPGYGGWNVAEQEWVLPILHGEELGVRLTEGLMMIPRKSITFAVTYGETIVSLQDEDMCDVCDMVKCRFKRTGKGNTKKEEKNERQSSSQN
jgi:cobalamin-dependent methionine synthase I